MAKKEKTVLVANKGGWGVDTSKLGGKKLTDEQAKIIVLQQLGEILDSFSVSVTKLADALKDARFR
jgi:hypothetical protein